MHTRSLCRLILALLLAVSPLAAQTLSPTPAVETIPTPQVAFQKYTLSNGLQVILVSDPAASRVHLNLWYHVGSKNEAANRTGFAHLFEHMMFEGSKDAPGNYGGWIEKAGGYENGNTTEDRTAFVDTVPSGSLEYTLWLEADRLATLPAAITADRLDIQKAVVRNELRERLENHPYADLPVLLPENLYPTGYPYAHVAIGSHDDVQAATVPEVKQFFKTFYAPNNLSLVVAGDFDPPQARRWIERYFGPIPPAAPIPRPARWLPRLAGDKVLDITDRATQPRLYLAWPVPSYLSDDSTHLFVAARILSRRLGASLIYAPKPLCTDLESDVVIHEDASMFYVVASAVSGVSLDELDARIRTELAAFAKTPPTDQELLQAKRRLEFDRASQFDTIESTAEVLNTGNVFAGNPADFAHRWQVLDDTTAADVTQAVQANLTAQGHLSIRVHPESFARQTAAGLNRAIVPAAHPALTIHPPQILSATLPNGLQILVAARPNAAKVLVRLQTRAGIIEQPKNQDAIALLTAACMPGATATRSGTQVRDAMEAAGATTISSDVSAEAAGLGFDVLAGTLDPAFTVFVDVLLHPAFKQSTLDTNVSQFREGLRTGTVTPGDTANDLIRSLVYGREHPYARRVATLEALDKIHTEDLRSFYEIHWKPRDSVLLFVGDITLDRAKQLAQTYLGAWAGNAPASPPLPLTKDTSAGRIYLVDTPGATQTLITQMMPAPGVNSPDRPALTLLSVVWGGMSGSRLEALRESLGDTYGANASVNQVARAGTITAQSPVLASKTGEALAEFARQLRQLQAQPITEDELQRAKQRELQRYADTFSSVDSVASYLAYLWDSGVPMASVQAEPDALQRTSLAAVQAVAARYLQPQNATYLLIGDRQTIDSQLKAFHLGPVTYITPEGTPVAP